MRWWSSVALVALALLAQGCGRDAQVEELRFGYSAEPGGFLDSMAHQWQELIAAADAPLAMSLHPSEQLGTKQELLSLIEQGSNVVTNVEYELLSERGAGELGLISVPYAFRNWDEVRAFEQGEGFKQALLWLERERNLKVLCSWHYAPRHFFARRPVHNLSDLQNRTILTRSSALHSTFFEAFGAIPASLRFSENDLLEQGLDAIDNTVVGFHDNFFVKFRNKRWHAYLDSHNFATFAVVTSARAFNALPKASRDLLYGTCNQVGERIESSMPAREERLRQEMVAAGLGVSAPDPNASHLEEAFREQFLASPVTLGHFSYSRYLELMDQLQGSR